MSLQNKVTNLEEKAGRLGAALSKPVDEMTDAELMAIVVSSPHDLTRLTDDELRLAHHAFDERGVMILERMTPALVAALERVKR